MHPRPVVKIRSRMNVDEDGKGESLAVLFDDIVEGKLSGPADIQTVLDANRRLLIDTASVADVDKEGFHFSYLTSRGS